MREDRDPLDISLDDEAEELRFLEAAAPWLSTGQGVALLFAIAGRVDPDRAFRELSAEAGEGFARMYCGTVAETLRDSKERLGFGYVPSEASGELSDRLSELAMAADPTDRTLVWVTETTLAEAVAQADQTLSAWTRCAG